MGERIWREKLHRLIRPSLLNDASVTQMLALFGMPFVIALIAWLAKWTMLAVYLSCLLPLGAIIAGLITPLPEFGATSEAGAPGRPPSVLKQLLGLFMKVGGLISAALGMVNTVLGKIGGGFVMCLNVVLCVKIQVVIASGVQIALGFA